MTAFNQVNIEFAKLELHCRRPSVDVLFSCKLDVGSLRVFGNILDSARDIDGGIGQRNYWHRVGRMDLQEVNL